MKKKIIAVLLFLGVSLTGCGGVNTSSSSSSKPSSTSISQPIVEEIPTYNEEFDSYQMFDGLAKKEFFELFSTVVVTTKEATTKNTLVAYEEGPAGPTFGLEEDYGYTHKTETSECKIYANSEISVCNIAAFTKGTANPTGTTKNYVDQTYFLNATTLVNVHDDGTGSYKVRENYKYTTTGISASAPRKNYINYAMSDTKVWFLQRMTEDFYNSVTTGTPDPDSTQKIKMFTTYENDKTTINAMLIEEYNGRYDGQAAVFNISITFREDGKVESMNAKYSFYYLMSPLFVENYQYDFGYNASEAFTGTKLNPELYLPLGTLIPEVEDGSLDGQTIDYLNHVLSAAQGKIAYKQPTDSLNQTYIDDQINDEFVYEEVYSTLYSDGVIASAISGETREDSYAYQTQISADDTHVYTIVTGDPDYGDYKIVEDMPADSTKEDILSLSEYDILATMVNYYNESLNLENGMTSDMGLTHHLPDEEEGDLEDYYIITMEFATQQHENYVGELTQFELGFSIEYALDGVTPTEIAVLWAFMRNEMSYDWDSYGFAQYYGEYSYYDMLSAAEHRYTILKPEDYDVLEEAKR